MQHTLKLIRWLLALVVILNGILSFTVTQNYMGGSIAVLCGLFILPPITAAISRRKPVGPWMPWVAFVCGLLASSVTGPGQVVKTRVKIKAEEIRQATNDSNKAIPDKNQPNPLERH